MLLSFWPDDPLRNADRRPRLVCFTVLGLESCWVVPDVFCNPAIYVVGIVIRDVPRIALSAVISFDMPEDVVRR